MGAHTEGWDRWTALPTHVLGRDAYAAVSAAIMQISADHGASRHQASFTFPTLPILRRCSIAGVASATARQAQIGRRVCAEAGEAEAESNTYVRKHVRYG